LEAAIQYGASVPGLTPTDTQKQINSEGFIEKHLERKSLVAVQTPQGFEFNKLYEAHKKSILENVEYTDDTEIWGKYCGAVKVIEGDSNNIKITYPADLKRIE
jgi:2-C-methyl-D-erythritol 4-phosphate cytidylyltransferase/2-C-methyl-D-erythritol 4-phosphate cytidylyltransferase/2-C-methyl-D-erythritol 2,4-cyclodiphosphate synthase